MKHKKIARKLLWTLGAIFLLMNVLFSKSEFKIIPHVFK